MAFMCMNCQRDTICRHCKFIVNDLHICKLCKITLEFDESGGIKRTETLFEKPKVNSFK